MLLSNNLHVNGVDEGIGRYVEPDTDKNLTNLVTGEEIKNDEYDFINLESASYYHIDKDSLNVTLWTRSLNGLTSINSLNGSVIYGILINSDPNSNTGIDGVDYDFQLRLDSNKKNAVKELKEISIEGYTKTIKSNKENYTKIIQKGANYINLDLDLAAIHTPDEFKVLFYAIFDPSSEQDNNSAKLLDYLRWIHLPQPEIAISTDPESIELTQGNNGDLTIKAKSNTSDAKIQFFFLNKPEDLKISFNNNSNSIDLPGGGEDRVQVTINADQTTNPRKLTLKLISEILIPGQTITYFNELYTNHTTTEDKPKGYIKNTVLKKQNFIQLQVNKYDIFDRIKDSWDKIGGPLTFIYIPLAAALPWIIKNLPRIRKNFENLKRKTKRDKKSSKSSS
jgi:hypothetical protein